MGRHHGMTAPATTGRVLMSGNEAVARGSWEAGVTVASSYPGTPATEILEAFARYPGVYAEWAPNEKVAFEVAMGASLAGTRSLVSMKHVGLTVAADPLMPGSYIGVRGGFLIAVSDDVGMGSSQNAQDTRYFARFAKVPLFEPSDSQEAKAFVSEALRLSEQMDTPVIMRLTMRISHVKGLVELGERPAPRFLGFSKDPAKYGFEGLEHNAPLKYDRVNVDGPTQLSLVARLSGSTDDEIKQLNPHLRMGVTPPGEKGYEVMVPAGRGETFLAAYQAMPESERTVRLATVHTVRRGETLATIASRYGTSVDELRSANSIRNPNRLSIGTQLTVPNAPDNAGPRHKRSGPTSAARYTPYHIVRKGDTLSSISRAYGLRLATLLDWNGLTERSIIRPGTRLIVSHDAVSQSGRSTRPGKTSAGFVSVPGGGQAPPDPAGEKVVYRVRTGDNLFRIARKYGTSVENLKAWNNIPGDGIRAGALLTIYPN